MLRLTSLGHSHCDVFVKRNQPIREKLISENEDLRRRLEEAEQTLNAIRRGDVDALVISGPGGEQVYTLKGAERPYRILLENMNEGALLMTPDGNIVYSNDRFTGMIQDRVSKVINSSIYDVFLPTDKALLTKVLQTQGKSEMVLPVTDGKAFPVYVSCTSFKMDDTPYVCMVVTDLTEQKRNEQIIAIEKVYRRIFDDMNEGAIIFTLARLSSRNGMILYSNSRFAKLVKRPLPKVIGSSIFEFIPEQDIHLIEPLLEVAQHGLPGEREIQLKTDDGDLVNVNLSIGSLSKKSVTYAIVTNLTEMKKREQESKRLASELLTAQETERKRIANELHDGLASDLAAIKMSWENKLDSMRNKTSTNIRIEDLITRIQKSIEELRRIMTSLHPSILDELGITATIHWHCREYQKTYPHIQINLQIEAPENEISVQLKTAIYRICQESLNNIAKHSTANLVLLSLCKSKEKIELAIKDNGQGFDLNEFSKTKKYRKGLGLGSMKERAEISGGSLSIESSPGAGTMIHASWPL